MSKFDPLRKYLSESGKQTVTLSFDELESKDILGRKLPESSRSHRAYFANTSTHSIAKAWLEAGYRVSSVDRHNRMIVFEKMDQSQDYLLSADVFEKRIKSKNGKNGKNYVSAFSLYEVIFFRGHLEKPVYQALLEQGITILDLNGRSIDFDLFQKKTANLKISLTNIYNSAILYTLVNCFANIFSGEEREKLINAFVSESEGNLIVDFPITSNRYDWNAVFKAIIRKLALKMQNPDFTYDSVVKKIGELEFSSMSLTSAPGITYMGINYLNYTLQRFIEASKNQTPFIPFSIVNEMLNMLIMNEKKNLLYLTAADDNFDILIGSIKNRVIKLADDEA